MLSEGSVGLMLKCLMLLPDQLELAACMEIVRI
jgi:hypothetical protein